MKTKLLFILISAFSISSTSLLVGQKKNPKAIENRVVEKVSTFTGKVSDWSYNNDYIYKGFYLNSGSDKFFVKFPPHLGKEIKQLVGNNTITVNGVLKYSPEGEKEIKWVNITSNGKQITDSPVPYTAPLPDKYITDKGTITGIQQDERGNNIGLIVDNKIILRVPPHKSDSLNSLLTKGSKIEFTGIEKVTKEGEAKYSDYSIVHCSTVTIDGQQYLVK